MKQYNLGVVGGIGTTCMIRLGETVNPGFLKDIFVNDDFGWWEWEVMFLYNGP